MASVRTRGPRLGERSVNHRDVRCDDCGLVVLSYAVPFDGVGLEGRGLETEDAYVTHVLEVHAGRDHRPEEPLVIEDEVVEAWKEIPRA